MNIEIANRLVKLRKEKGYSQEELAEKLGISRQAVSKWERAESSPDTDNLICLAKLYGISLDDLLNSDQSIEEIARDVKEKRLEEAEAEPVNEVPNHEEEKTAGHEEEEAEKEPEGAERKRKSWKSYFGKDGFHYKDGENEVHLGPGGIHVYDEEDGSYVSVDPSGVNVWNGKSKKEGEKSYTSYWQQAEDTPWKGPRNPKARALVEILRALIFTLSVVAYILFGCLYPDPAKGWGAGWTFMLFGMTLCSVLDCVYKRRLYPFGIAYLATGIYCFLGIMYGWWHPHWLIMLSIPLYYLAVSPLDKVLKWRKFPGVHINWDDDDEEDEAEHIDAEKD